MNISFENVSKVQGLLTVSLEKSDYQENLEKSMREYKKKINMPGFRPGMVPMSLIQRMYGKSIKAEEINRILQEKVSSYIRDNAIDMLGEPLPNNEKEAGQSMDDDDFKFYFDIALAPQFDTSVSRSDSVPYYEIEVSDEMVESQVKSYAQRNGSYEKVDSFEENDMLKGRLVELDADGKALENGKVIEEATLIPGYLPNEDVKKLFKGAKVGTEVRFAPAKAYNGNAVQISSLLNCSKEEAGEVNSDFAFTVSDISRFVPGKLNQELFDQVFGKDAVKSEDEFRAKVRESMAASFVPDSDYRFLIDVREYMTKRIGRPEYAEDLLKRIMEANRSGKASDESEESFQKSLDELTWHLVKERMVKANSIKVEESDVLAQAREATRAQFAQYGMMNIPDELLDNYAKDMMKKRETVDNLVDRAVESKLVAALKGQFNLKKKKVSMAEFNKLFEAAPAAETPSKKAPAKAKAGKAAKEKADETAAEEKAEKKPARKSTKKDSSKE